LRNGSAGTAELSLVDALHRRPFDQTVTRDVHTTCGTTVAIRRTTMIAILSWIVFGLIVGALAKLVMPGNDPGGIIITILLGIAGALVGGLIGRAMGFYGSDQTAGYLMSIVGAIVLLALYRMVARRSA
jgi:uncharacterized membrane protein YeaQ/YmgE (transglycosylase-associated protein family)